MTPWDRLLGARTATACLLLTLLAMTVLIATDEREATAAARLARVCALAPALAALAILVLTKRLETTGELRALAASGVSRSRALRGAIGVAVALGLLGALALAGGGGSLDGLFPPLSGEVWRTEGRGFVAPGVALTAVDGDVTFLATHAVPTPRSLRGMVAGAIALFALGLPAWTALAQRWPSRLVVGLGLALGAIVCFHAVAAGHRPALLLVPPLALLATLGLLALRSRAHELRSPG